MIVVGMDPSLSNWGLVKVDLQGRIIRPITSDVIVTTALSKKKAKNIYKNEEDLERALQLRRGILSFIGVDTEHIYVELPSGGGKSARAQISYGVCLGVFSNVTCPFTVIRNTEIKKFVGYGNQEVRKVEKEEVIQKMKGLGYVDIFKGHVKSLHEHIADAMAAICVGAQK